MDVEKEHRHSKEKHATLKELRWYFFWGRFMFWWFTVLSVIVTTYTVYSFSAAIWLDPPAPSLASCVRSHPDFCTSPLLDNKQFQIGQAPAIDSRSISNVELTSGSSELLPRDAATSVAVEKRIDWNNAYQRYSVAMAPVAVVAGAMNMWGLVNDCEEWHTNIVSGETTGATYISGVKCVGNAITTAMLFVGSVWGGTLFYAELSAWFQNNAISVGGCCSKRDHAEPPKDIDPADMQRISDIIGYPVSHLGRHYHSFGSDTTNSTHHTHYSNVFSLEHPKGAVHFAYMGNDTDGSHVLQFGLGSGKGKAAANTAVQARSGPDQYYYFNQQGFRFGSGIMIRGINNPDGIAADEPAAFNPDWAWDAIHAQASCYLDYNWETPGWRFQVYDDEYQGTAFAGALAPFSATIHSQIQSMAPGSGLVEWPQCMLR